MGPIPKKSFLGPIGRSKLASTNFIDVTMIFLELVPHFAIFVLAKKYSERSGSFFCIVSKYLRIAVRDGLKVDE